MLVPLPPLQSASAASQRTPEGRSKPPRIIPPQVINESGQDARKNDWRRDGADGYRDLQMVNTMARRLAVLFRNNE
jgi:hypothetical protein